MKLKTMAKPPKTALIVSQQPSLFSLHFQFDSEKKLTGHRRFAVPKKRVTPGAGEWGPQE